MPTLKRPWGSNPMRKPGAMYQRGVRWILAPKPPLKKGPVGRSGSGDSAGRRRRR